MASIASQPGVRTGILPASAWLRMLLLGAIALMAAVSTYVGVKEAAFSDPATEGTDFQWSGAHLLSQHEDPWYLFIHHQDQGKIILGQQPNYLAELFLFLWPLGRLPFPQAAAWWCLCNLLFTAAALYIVGKMFRLDRLHLLLVTLLLMASMPFRVTLHIGQHGLLILLMLCIAFYSRNLLGKGLALGVSYGKYSFSPLIVMMLLVKRRFGMVLVSMIPPLLGVFIAWRMLGGSFVNLAIEPIAVSKLAMGPGSGDIMTPLEIFLRNLGVASGLTFSIPAALGLCAAAVSAIWIGRSKRMDEKMQFAVALVMTLICFKHVMYDFVVLVVPVAAAVVAPRSRARAVVLLGAGFFWFLTPFVRYFSLGVNAAEVFLYSLLLLAIAIATSRLYPPNNLEMGSPAATA